VCCWRCTQKRLALADGGLRDAAPVQQTRVPLSNGLVAIVRTGELVHGDGTLGVHADSVVARDAGMSADVALQTAMTMLRSPARLPLAARPLPVLVPPARTPVFYDTTAYPFMGARLLGGFRLWSAMRARHAHRDLYDDDLDAVFDRVIPRLEAARSAEEYAKGIAELAASLDDTEGALLGTSASAVIGEAAMPFRVRSAEGRVHVTDVVRDSTTTALGIVPGTEITAFDGFPMVAWLSEHRRVQPASNDWSRTRALMRQLSRGRIGDVVMKVRDANNRERTLTVPRTVAYREALPVVSTGGRATTGRRHRLCRCRATLRRNTRRGIADGPRCTRTGPRLARALTIDERTPAAPTGNPTALDGRPRDPADADRAVLRDHSRSDRDVRRCP
jgi:hypothetical protein